MKDPEIMSVEELKEGHIIRGYVKSVEKCGVFIRSDIWFEPFMSCYLCLYELTIILIFQAVKEPRGKSGASPLHKIRLQQPQDPL